MKYKLIVILGIIVVLLFGSFLVINKNESGISLLDKIIGEGIVSAGLVEPITINYTNDNMIIEFIEGTELVGLVTLLSHKTYNETLEITSGKDRVVIWYEFSNFSKPKLNMLGEVLFIDMRQGIENESVLKDGGFIDVNDLIILNPNYNKSYKKNYTWVYMTKEGDWLPYVPLDVLPKTKIILGIQTDLAWGEFMDVQLSILNNTLDKHALVLGTNCGFVTTAPTDDPGGVANNVFDGYYTACKHTSPANVIKIIEIGWWCDTATEASNFEVGVYDDNQGTTGPGSLLSGVSRTNAKGTDAGWKVRTGLNITITAETVYWLAVQLDNTATTTYADSAYVAGSQGYRETASTLPSSETSNQNTGSTGWAIYAVWEAGAPSTCWSYDPANKMLSIPTGCLYQAGSL